MNKSEYIDYTLERLDTLLDENKLTPHGICSFMAVELWDLTAIFQEWPENTEKNPSYPVPSTHPDFTQGRMYLTTPSFTYFDDTPYGDARRRLVDYIAEWIEDHREEL